MSFFAVWHVGLTLYSLMLKRRSSEDESALLPDDSSGNKIIQFGMLSFLLGSFGLSTALVVLIAQA